MIGHKVLAPLDGSVTAALALNHAKRFISPNGQLYLLSVMDPQQATRTFISDVAPSRTLLQERQSYLKSEILRLSQQGITATAAVEIGDPVHLIVGKSHYCDLILLTAHGWAEFRPERYGEVVQQVLNRAACPVVVIPLNRFESLEIHEPRRSAANA